jgi:predicted ATPase with chaperone activity
MNELLHNELLSEFNYFKTDDKPGRRPDSPANDVAQPPPIPDTVKDTGLTSLSLNCLLLKALYTLGLETNVELAEHLKLSRSLVDNLLNALKQQGFVETRGSIQGTVFTMRYGLTNAGKQFAMDAVRQCEYVGPAPVSLSAFQAQIRKQSIRNEQIDLDDLAICLSHLVIPERLLRRLGPAINSAQAMLIYGPPGNGKTAISQAIGKIYSQPVYVPRSVEVERQVIRVFDPKVHSEIPTPKPLAGDNGDAHNLLRKSPDPRWIKCKRPVVLLGGELTLNTLDLQYDTTSKFYEAPPQVKALGGVCIVDDFGRQRLQPSDLLNRWIVPMESGIDYLMLHTGSRIAIPFDELLIFSTNIPPLKLMDTAQLRRVKYKLRVEPPSMVDYALIFRRACKEQGLELPDSVLTHMLENFYPTAGIDKAGFHPVFIVEHAIAACRYKGVAPQITLSLVEDALEDLFIKEDHEPDLARQLALAQDKIS